MRSKSSPSSSLSDGIPLSKPSPQNNLAFFSSSSSLISHQKQTCEQLALNVSDPQSDRKRAISPTIKITKGKEDTSETRSKEKNIEEKEKSKENRTLDISIRPKVRRAASTTALTEPDTSQSHTRKPTESPSLPVIEIKKSTKSSPEGKATDRELSCTEQTDAAKQTLANRAYLVKSRSTSNLAGQHDKDKRLSGELTVKTTTLTNEKNKRTSLTVPLPMFRPSEQQNNASSSDTSSLSLHSSTILKVNTEVNVSQTKKMVRRQSDRTIKNNTTNEEAASNSTKSESKEKISKGEQTKTKLKQFFGNIPFFGKLRKEFKSNFRQLKFEEHSDSSLPSSDKSLSAREPVVSSSNNSLPRDVRGNDKNLKPQRQKRQLLRSPSSSILKKHSNDLLIDSESTAIPSNTKKTLKQGPEQMKLKTAHDLESDTSQETNSKDEVKRQSFRKSLSLQNLKNIITRKPKSSITHGAETESNSLQDKTHENSASPAAFKVPIFGTPLKLLYSQDGGVPKFVVRCVEYIEEHGTELEGIFRVSVGATEQQEAKNSIECGNFNFTNLDPLAVAFMLKNFFAELPEPLFTFKLFSKFVDCSIDCSDRKEILKRVRPLLDELPLAHVDTMNYLFNFLHRFSAHSAKTRMDKRNLAIVFAPSLLRPQVTTLENANKVASSFLVVEAMLENPKSLFDKEPTLPKSGTVNSLPPPTAPLPPPLVLGTPSSESPLSAIPQNPLSNISGSPSSSN
jgi:hypothetical protein